MPERGVESADDVFENLAAGVGTFQTLFGIPNCRQIYFRTAGTFIGLTVASGTARTITRAAGDVVNIRFKSRTGGTADVDVLY